MHNYVVINLQVAQFQQNEIFSCQIRATETKE